MWGLYREIPFIIHVLVVFFRKLIYLFYSFVQWIDIRSSCTRKSGEQGHWIHPKNRLKMQRQLGPIQEWAKVRLKILDVGRRKPTEYWNTWGFGDGCRNFLIPAPYTWRASFHQEKSFTVCVFPYPLYSSDSINKLTMNSWCYSCKITC